MYVVVRVVRFDGFSRMTNSESLAVERKKSRLGQGNWCAREILKPSPYKKRDYLYVQRHNRMLLR